MDAYVALTTQILTKSWSHGQSGMVGHDKYLDVLITLTKERFYYVHLTIECLYNSKINCVQENIIFNKNFSGAFYYITRLVNPITW